MSQFHEHPDGIIIVRTQQGNYADTRENFVLDYRWQIPERPTWCVERLYDDTGSGFHKLIDDKGNHLDEGPVPWPWGDNCIAAIATILQRKTARLAAETQAAQDAIDAARQAAQNANAAIINTAPTNVLEF